jgi:FtsH-binding integral membrane protein
MSYSPEMYERDVFAADAAVDERVAFIRRVYAHVGGATLLFVGLVAGFINTPQIAEPLAGYMLQSWWLVFIAFMAATWVAQRMAYNSASPGMQYLGLGLYTVAEALIFTPILYIMHAKMPGGDDLILQAGILTLVIFGGLTLVVMITRTDFSFLRQVLTLGMLAAFALMIVAAFTSLSLGTWFCVGMIVLMGGYILYDTSNVLHHYHTTQHVAAALALFSSLTTLFWYVLRLTSILSDD